MRMVNGPWLVSLLCWWATNQRLRFCSVEDSLLLLLLSFSSLCRVFTVIYLKQTVFLWHIYCCSCAVFTTCATWNVVWYVKYILCSYIRACGSAVGWGTTLQVWRSRVHSRLCHWNVSLTKSFQPHCGPWVDSVSDGNDDQEYFLGDRCGWYVGLMTNFMCQLSWNLGVSTS